MAQNFTDSEVKENDGQNGRPVWIIVKGVVYNVTDFLKDHPGGEDTLLEYAGKDATKAFNQVGHSADAIRDMKLYKVGVVADESNFSCKRRKSVTTVQPSNTATPISESTTNQCCSESEKSRKFFCCC